MSPQRAATTGLNGESVFRTVMSWLIDYFRWSQMVPMIMVWIFVLFGLAGITLINFQEQTISGVEAVFGFWERQAWLPRFDEAWLDPVTEEDGSTHIGGEDFRAMAFKLWAGLSLILLVLDLIRRWIFGPPAPPNLVRQLLIAGLAATALFAAYLLNYLFGSEDFHGGPAQWMFVFMAFALIAWLASAYSLVVNFVLGKLSRLVDPPPSGTKPGYSS